METKEQKYTVFSADRLSMTIGAIGTPLKEVIDAAIRHGLIPGSWMPGPGSFTGEVQQQCAESISAGRVIEKIGDKYIAKGVPDTKQEQVFRVGKCYLLGLGVNAVRVLSDDGGRLTCELAQFREGISGWWDAVTGLHLGKYENIKMLPGEVQYVDGHWVPIQEKPDTVSEQGEGLGIASTDDKAIYEAMAERYFRDALGRAPTVTDGNKTRELSHGERAWLVASKIPEAPKPAPVGTKSNPHPAPLGISCLGAVSHLLGKG